MKFRNTLSILAITLAAGAALQAARPADAARVDATKSALLSQRASLGLDAQHGFQVIRSSQDELGMTHAHFQQTFQGVKVFGGEVIGHTDREGGLAPFTLGHKGGISINTVPALSATEALGAVNTDLSPRGAYAYTPKVELVILPQTTTLERVNRRTGETTERELTRYVLAYKVETQLENGTEETAHWVHMVNAHTGAVIEKWDDLHTVGSGNSQYSGNVSLGTTAISGGYELRDAGRGSLGGNYTTNLNHATSGTGTIYTDADNGWGDGANYVEGSSTTAANGQTAAVDAHYGQATTWDMFKNAFGRNGIDGAGTRAYSRVHYSNSYDNAFWSDSCFCMTYGDGNSFLTLTAPDVAGHEMTHGVTSRTAGLTYRGESGGLNESMSDIFGTMAEFYGRSGNGGTTMGTTGGNWTIGEQLATPSFNRPLRYMYKPSLDGRSPDAWSNTLKRLDVHYSSGPMNRCFYFLSQGTGTGNYASSYLPGGMTGIGNDRAARIVFRALSTYMTSSTVYSGAKTACLKAATDLYGTGGTEYNAVVNAFKAINVN